MTDEEIALCNYLTTIHSALSQNKKWEKSPRTYCCAQSCSLYCPDCCTLLLPEEDIPTSIKERELSLPIDIDIAFHDNRSYSSVIQAICVFNYMKNRGRRRTTDDAYHHTNTTSLSLYDSFRGDSIPDYNQNKDNTYLLFPCEGESVPISSVSNNIKKLVVLDCKWTKTLKHLKHPAISKLPKVHLTNPPNSSQYWRWHSAGNGMVSTLEAIYYASCEILKYRDSDADTTMSSSSSSLLDLFFLFATKRSVMTNAVLSKGELEPFSEAAKSQRREERRCKGTLKHLRDKEIGKLMKGSDKHLKDKEIGIRLKELKQQNKKYSVGSTMHSSTR